MGNRLKTALSGTDQNAENRTIWKPKARGEQQLRVLENRNGQKINFITELSCMLLTQQYNGSRYLRNTHVKAPRGKKKRETVKNLTSLVGLDE